MDVNNPATPNSAVPQGHSLLGNPNLTRSETAQRAAQITLESVDVWLDLSDAHQANITGFPSVTTLDFSSTTDRTWIDFIGEAVHHVEVNGRAQPVEWDGARITVRGLESRNQVRITATAAYSRSGEGMHRYVDPADGQTYLYTQYEPADARRVMACFEQPDIKGRFTFNVNAPMDWVVLSNARALTTRTVEFEDGLRATRSIRQIEFEPTLPISSYITCVIAGPYARVQDVWDSPAGDVELSVLCRASLSEHMDAAAIFEVTKAGLEFFTGAFSSPYPWGKYDQIFVPEYNLGAMENPGLVTFTEAYVFQGAATAAQYEARANTILHEMAHMWFGDLVTMRWWDDLWLKESFADYMGTHAAAVTGFPDAWVTFANRRKAWAYEQDQRPTTHPIVADIADLEAAKLNFDGITYAKGAAVLKQLVAFVGVDQFFESARRYFERHAFGNTTLNDLVLVLEEVSGLDLGEWVSSWLQTTGVSTLSHTYEGDRVRIQQNPARPHRMRAATYSWENAGDSAELVLQRAVDVTITEMELELDFPGWEQADLRLLNQSDWTYAKTRLDDESLATARAGLSRIDSALDRALVWSALWNAVRDAQLSVAVWLEIVTVHSPAETNSGLLSAALSNTREAIESFADTAHLPTYRAVWLRHCWKMLHSREPNTDAQLAWARAFAHAARFDDSYSEYMRAWLADESPAPGGLRLDADLRWSLVIAAMATGHGDEVLVEAEARRDPSGRGATHRIEALASRRDTEVRRAAWDQAWTSSQLSNEGLSSTIAGLNTSGWQNEGEYFTDNYFSRIQQVWGSRSIEIAGRLVRGLFPTRSPGIAHQWLTDHPEAPAALRRLVIEQLDDSTRAAAARILDGTTSGIEGDPILTDGTASDSRAAGESV